MIKLSHRRELYVLMFGVVIVAFLGLVVRPMVAIQSNYLKNRTVIVSQHLNQISSGREPFAVVVGNSLVERNYVAELCGYRVVNAGVGRAKIDDLTEIARLVRASHPEIRVLSVGVNDAAAGISVVEFGRAYRKLVAVLEPTHVVGITGIQSDQYNKEIRGLSGRAIYVEPLADKYLQDDGVHYTTDGSFVWRAGIEQTCASSAA